jgi:hypothetical protein
MKLKDLISEVVSTYQIQASIMSKREVNITHILDQIRGVDKVTIINNITPEDYFQKDEVEFTRVQIKFVTRNNPKDDLKPMKDAMLHSNVKKGIFKINGLMNLRWNEDTLKKMD